jgi:four helix bundle protein
MNAKEFSERMWDFAVRVAQTVELLPETRVGRHVAGQLVRCGTASAPNYDEACDAESRKDFAHKLGIAAKEMRETSGWLLFIVKFGLLPASQITPLHDEAMQLRRMLGRSLKTLGTRTDLPPDMNNEQ